MSWNVTKLRFRTFVFVVVGAVFPVCFSMLQVHVLFCLFVLGCQYQYSQLPGKARLQNVLSGLQNPTILFDLLQQPLEGAGIPG